MEVANRLVGAGVVAVDYYCAMSEQALQKADAETHLSGFFSAVALAYRTLADSEIRFCDRFPHRPPRIVKRTPFLAAAE